MGPTKQVEELTDEDVQVLAALIRLEASPSRFGAVLRVVDEYYGSSDWPTRQWTPKVAEMLNRIYQVAYGTDEAPWDA